MGKKVSIKKNSKAITIVIVLTVVINLILLSFVGIISMSINESDVNNDTDNMTYSERALEILYHINNAKNTSKLTWLSIIGGEYFGDSSYMEKVKSNFESYNRSMKYLQDNIEVDDGYKVSFEEFSNNVNKYIISTEEGNLFKANNAYTKVEGLIDIIDTEMNNWISQEIRKSQENIFVNRQERACNQFNDKIMGVAEDVLITILLISDFVLVAIFLIVIRILYNNKEKNETTSMKQRP